jgi:hypothetical protein
VLWDNSFGEQWWIGIEGVHDGILFLHKFAQPDMPEHRGIVAVEIRSGHVLWQNDGWKFEGASGNALFASSRSLTGGMFFEADFRSGITTGEFSSEEAVKQAAKVTTNGIPESEKFPLFLPDIDSGDSEITSLIRNHSDAGRLVGPVEYLELRSLLVYAYHERTPSSTHERMVLDHHLNVVSEDEVLFSEILNRNAPAVMAGNFFVENDMLFFVHERTKLTAVQLLETGDEGDG